MLDYAHQRAIQALSTSHKVVLATSGPAGVQASEVRCQAEGLELYLLVPKVSDHLFNLENNPDATLLAAGWEVKGKARIVPAGEARHGLDLLREPEAEWCLLVRVHPCRVQILRDGGWGNLETIDLMS